MRFRHIADHRHKLAAAAGSASKDRAAVVLVVVCNALDCAA